MIPFLHSCQYYEDRGHDLGGHGMSGNERHTIVRVSHHRVLADGDSDILVVRFMVSTFWAAVPQDAKPPANTRLLQDGMSGSLEQRKLSSYTSESMLLIDLRKRLSKSPGLLGAIVSKVLLSYMVHDASQLRVFSRSSLPQYLLDTGWTPHVVYYPKSVVNFPVSSGQIQVRFDDLRQGANFQLFVADRFCTSSTPAFANEARNLPLRVNLQSKPS